LTQQQEKWTWPTTSNSNEFDETKEPGKVIKVKHSTYNELEALKFAYKASSFDEIVSLLIKNHRKLITSD
jgi:hypothetical protein